MRAPLVDFLPPDYRARRLRKRLLATRGLVVVILLAGMIAASALAANRERSLNRELNGMLAKHEIAKERIRQIEELDRKKAELQQRLGVLSAILRRTRGSAVLDSIAKSSPESISLTKVECHQRDAATKPETEVTIEGRCPHNEDIADIMRALSAQPLLYDVQLKFSEDEDATHATKKFVITARAPGQVELGEGG